MSVLLKVSELVLQFEPEFLEQFPDGVVKVYVLVFLASSESEVLVPWRSTSPFETDGTSPAVFEATIECIDSTGGGDIDAGRSTATFETIEFLSFSTRFDEPDEALASSLMSQTAMIEVRLLRGSAFDMETDPRLGILRVPLRAALAETSTLRYEARIPLEKKQDGQNESSKSLLVDHGASSFLTLIISPSNELFDAMVGGAVLTLSDAAIHAVPLEWFSTELEGGEGTDVMTFDLEVSLQRKQDVTQDSIIDGAPAPERPQTLYVSAFCY